MRTGTCKFGSGCKFSHDNTHSPTGQSSGTKPKPQQHTGDGKLLEWKRILRHTIFPSHGNTAGRFFQLGLELMDGDLGAAQEAFKLLATEEGLGFVKNLTDRQVPTATSTASAPTLWATDLQPFFKLITHRRAVDCASLEQEVANIFNFVYGIGGSRMERVFKFVTQLLPTLPTEANGRLSSSIDAIELSLDVLSKILDCNTVAIVDNKLSVITKIFSAAVNGLSRGGKDFSHLQAIKFLEYIRLRLDVGAEIGTLRDRPSANVVRDQFVLRRDLPGRLSADGRRHDNDHANITKIQILPTYEEIVSPRVSLAVPVYIRICLDDQNINSVPSVRISPHDGPVPVARERDPWSPGPRVPPPSRRHSGAAPGRCEGNPDRHHRATNRTHFPREKYHPNIHLRISNPGIHQHEQVWGLGARCSLQPTVGPQELEPQEERGMVVSEQTSSERRSCLSG